MTTVPILIIMAICIIGSIGKELFKASEQNAKNEREKKQNNLDKTAKAEIDNFVVEFSKDPFVSAVTKVEKSLDGRFIVTFLDLDNKRQTAVY